jgi:hypothetical protein
MNCNSNESFVEARVFSLSQIPHTALTSVGLHSRSYQIEIHVKLSRYGIRMSTKRDSSVGVALGYGLDDGGSSFRFPAWNGNFSFHHRVQKGSGAHPASHPMGTRGSFLWAKATGAWSWPLVSIYCRGQRIRGAISPLPHTRSWRGAQLRKAQWQR